MYYGGMLIIQSSSSLLIYLCKSFFMNPTAIVEKKMLLLVVLEVWSRTLLWEGADYFSFQGFQEDSFIIDKILCPIVISSSMV